MRSLALACAGAYYAGMRKPYNMNIESGVIDQLRAEAPEVNRSRLVEQLIVRWLADRGQALGAVSGNPEAREGDSGPGRDAPAAKPPTSPRAPVRVKEPVEETPLPKIAKRHWAQ